MNQMINMVIRLVMRKLLNRGIDAGINAVASRGKRPADMTPAEREQAASARAQGKNARKMMKAGRRITRM